MLNDQTVRFGNLLTRDRGKTWTTLADKLAAPIAAVPSGWRIYLGQVGTQSEEGSTAPARMYAVDPTNGDFHPLSTAPTMTATDAGSVIEASDGSFWAGISAYQGKQGVERSATTEATPGRPSHPRKPPTRQTWRNSRSPARTGEPVTPSLEHPFPARRRIFYRTTNGGATWTKISSPIGLNSLAALTNGSVLGVHTVGSDRNVSHQLMISTDDGLNFTEVTAPPVHGLATAENGVVVLIASQNRVHTTVDGKTFDTIVFPAEPGSVPPPPARLDPQRQRPDLRNQGLTTVHSGQVASRSISTAT
ncbi:beta propeller repeat protein [Fodinicola feengrottensis]|uniref:hypothetical protein n=1 Tax=Fodinicola feengrottensis TaxID=435914 RepID=UPI0013D3D079|nr:hypothetical protein [Fodinicola feengrottensis]